MYYNNINNNFKTLLKIFKIIIYKNKINNNKGVIKMKVKDVKKFVEVAHNKKFPRDVQEFFKEVRKGKAVEEMDFVHFVRAMRKEARR